MSDPQFQTVFDLAVVGYTGWQFATPGLILAAVGALLVLAPRLFDGLSWGFIKGAGRGIFSWIFFLFAAGWTVFALGSTYSEYAELRGRQQSGRFESVEGIIENLKSDAKVESFDVRGVHFEYSYFVVSAGFNTPATHGGPMRANLYVRIEHVDGKIIRLEIREDAPPNPL
jgi:hypothetical protein